MPLTEPAIRLERAVKAKQLDEIPAALERHRRTGRADCRRGGRVSSPKRWDCRYP